MQFSEMPLECCDPQSLSDLGCCLPSQSRTHAESSLAFHRRTTTLSPLFIDKQQNNPPHQTQKTPMRTRWKKTKEFAFYLPPKRENPKLEIFIMADSANFKGEVHQI